MLKLILTSLFCFVLFLNLSCQNKNPVPSKTENGLYQHSLYGTGGIGYYAAAISIDYDYHLVNLRHLKFGPKFALGYLGLGDSSGGEIGGPVFSTAANLLLGTSGPKGAIFLEVGFGFQFLRINKTERTQADDFYLFMGTRFGSEKFFIRMGLGIPGLAQMSVGRNF